MAAGPVVSGATSIEIVHVVGQQYRLPAEGVLDEQPDCLNVRGQICSLARK